MILAEHSVQSLTQNSTTAVAGIDVILQNCQIGSTKFVPPPTIIRKHCVSSDDVLFPIQMKFLPPNFLKDCNLPNVSLAVKNASAKSVEKFIFSFGPLCESVLFSIAHDRSHPIGVFDRWNL